VRVLIKGLRKVLIGRQRWREIQTANVSDGWENAVVNTDGYDRSQMAHAVINHQRADQLFLLLFAIFPGGTTFPEGSPGDRDNVGNVRETTLQSDPASCRTMLVRTDRRALDKRPERRCFPTS